MPLSLVRHTTPDVPEGTCYGRTDLALARSFADEAASVNKQLGSIQRIITSPLLRCRKLADFLSRQRGIPVELDKRLREMDFGSWEGRLWDDIPQQELDEWSIDFLHARTHGGESVAMLRARVTEFVDSVQASDEHTLAVTHAGVIKVALASGEKAEDFKKAIEFGQIVALPLIESD